MPRKTYYVSELDKLTEEEATLLRTKGILAKRLVDQESYHDQVNIERANLISSRVDVTGFEEDVHAPVLDIDFHAELIPSSSPDHYHLYIDKAMTWEKYEKLLRVLEECGIISKGYLGASLARKATYVRKPGVKKTPKSKDS